MSRAGRSRRQRWLVAFGFFLLLVVFPYCAWNIQIERVTEVDINSGRLRVRTEFMGYTITEEFVDWPFSDAVADHGLATDTPDFKFAWSSPIGPRKMLGEPDAVSMYGRTLADLQSTVQFATRHDMTMLEKENVARLLQLLEDNNNSGLHAFASEFISTNG